MPDYANERELLNSQLALFNQIIRSKGQAFLDGINQEIERLIIGGADRQDAMQIVIKRTILSESGQIETFKEDMIREFRKLIGSATIGVFQSRLEALAAEAAISTQGDVIPTDSESGTWIWVAILSSATCRWNPKSAKYEMNGKRLTPENFCANRHGMKGDAAFWDEAGRPREGQTVCLSQCECSLVPIEFARSNPGLLEPVDLTG